MAQFDKSVQPNDMAILQDILQLVTESPTLANVAPIILDGATRLLEADAGFYLVFEGPHLVFVHNLDEATLPDGDMIYDSVEGLGQDIHVSSQVPPPLDEHFKGWLQIPVMHKNKTAGVVGLLFKEDVLLSDEASGLMSSLLNSLAIVTSIEKANARHNKLMQNQYEFVRIVSHDLRSPLTSIKGFASMLESAEEDPKLKHFVTKILNGVTQMAYLVDNIQDAGRYDPETGFYEMERSPADLVEMVTKIVNTHLVPAEKEDLSLTVNISDNIPIVNVDTNMIERSITNLVDNAIKYTPNGGEIEVGLHKEDNDIVITISDNGYGISEENRRKLFNRNFRIPRREHSRIKGSGLGLFIVRSVAQYHGGDAFVQSIEGEGSTFGIRIPLDGKNLLGGSA